MTDGDHVGTGDLPEITMRPVGEPAGLAAPRLMDNSTAAGFLVLSLAIWAVPLLVYAHANAGQPGNAELPGDLGSLIAELMAVGLLILLLPTGLALLTRWRYAAGFGIATGISAVMFAVIATLAGFFHLGPMAVLALLHALVAGAGVVVLLARRVGNDLHDVGTAAVSLGQAINVATKPKARPVVWALLGLAVVLEGVRTATDSRVTLQTIGVPRTLHAWVLHLIALSVVALAAIVIRQNKT